MSTRTSQRVQHRTFLPVHSKRGTPEASGELERSRKERLELSPMNADQRLSHDFSKLRVHADSRPTESERVVNPVAHTMRRDVGFGFGQLGPGATRQPPISNTQQAP